MLIGSGLGRRMKVVADDNGVVLRIRCRRSRRHYHVIRVYPDDDVTKRLAAQVIPDSDWKPSDEFMDGVSVGDVIEGYVLTERTPERLKQWRINKERTENVERL
jgi:hypothetical protein